MVPHTRNFNGCDWEYKANIFTQINSETACRLIARRLGPRLHLSPIPGGVVVSARLGEPSDERFEQIYRSVEAEIRRLEELKEDLEALCIA